MHRGHRTVIAAAARRAKTLGAPAVALTFEPHPRRFLRPESPLFRLTDENTKLRLLAASGLDGALVLTFDRSLASLSAEDFITRILVGRLAVKGVATSWPPRANGSASRSRSCRRSKTRAGRSPRARSAPRSPPAA